MRSSAFARVVAALVLSAVCLLAPGCGADGFQGTYHSTAGGAITFDFKGDKVTVTFAGQSETYDYKVEGDRITIVNPTEGDIVLTRNSDGSLNGAMGTFAKRKE